MRPTPRSPRRRTARSLARTAAVALTGLATLAAGLVLASPASRRQPGHAGQLHGLRLRPVHGADPAVDGRLADELAVLGGRHLHLGGLARLPQPAEPVGDLGQQPAREGVAAAADHPRPAGLVHHAGALPPAGPDQPVVHGQLRRGAQPGRGRGGQDRRRRAGAGHLGPAAPCGTTWRPSRPRRTDCRESALAFLSAWTERLHARGYVSGVYSSAASAIKMLDDARATRPGAYVMPDQLWVADWNGRADTASTYLRSDGWTPHRRVHQYRGGHNETYGGVTINIDNNWVDLGRGSVAPRERSRCGGVATELRPLPLPPGRAHRCPGEGGAVPAHRAEAVRRRGGRRVRRRARRRRPQLPVRPRASGRRDDRPSRVGGDAGAGHGSPAEVRRRLGRRTPAPARVERRRRRGPRGHRCLRGHARPPP